MSEINSASPPPSSMSLAVATVTDRVPQEWHQATAVLPFVRIRPFILPDRWTLDCWAAEATMGAFMNPEDFEIGRGYAEAALKFAREMNFCLVIEAALVGIIDRKRYDDIVTGFLSRIAQAAHHGSLN